MVGNLRKYFGVIVLLLWAAPSAGQTAGNGVTVTGQGFCLKKTELKCEEVAMSGVLVPIERLPMLEDGSRGIYFYSDQETNSNAIFVHVLEAEDAEAHVDYVIADSTKAKKANLSSALHALAAKIGGVGGVSLTPFLLDNSKPQKSRVFSSIHVEGPGIYSGRVLDINGVPIPISERISFTVIRELGPDASRKKPGAPISGYDDGYE